MSSDPVLHDQPGYLAAPARPNGKRILVLHAWWGLTPFFRGICDRLAGEGYTVFAPDLYQGATATTIDGATELRDHMDFKRAAAQLLQAAQSLQDLNGTAEPGLGMLGFSLGGFWALWLACQSRLSVKAAVAFYASRSGDYSGSQAAFQLHLAEKDVYEPAEEIAGMQHDLQAAGRLAEFYTYAGTSHWFFEENQAAYNPQAAALAWQRSLDFFAKQL